MILRKKWRKRILILVVLLPLLSFLWLLVLAWTRVPMLDGEIAHSSLTADVTVKRDDWGVPHIEAEAEVDAYFALGYVMGQDRLFQMELLRRVANGELSAVLGGKLTPVDALVRSFQLRSKAEATNAMLAREYPETYALMEAFTDGINFRMEQEALPFEFAVLAMPARPFSVVDCLSIGALLPITFADGLRGDPLFSILEEKLPDHDIAELFPGYHRGTPVTIMETLEEARQHLDSQDDTFPGTQASRESVVGLEALLALLNPLSDQYGPALGSNSWLLGPSRTKSGKAILANDPHIAFTNPSIWYEAQITLPDFELYGYYLPLVPVALLGQNEHHAWGLTMFANDDLDMYRETFNPDDPDQVMYNGAWTPVERSEDVIEVRWGDDVPIQLRRTPHGPVVTDLLHALFDYEGPDVALSWVWQQVDYTDMLAFYRMGHATSYEEFEAALSLVTSPGINVSYADVDDNIAWWAAGKIPIRPDHVNNKALLDGASGKDEWLGFVPFAENPHLHNPPGGFIVTANNKSTVKPVGAVKDLPGYWQPDDRAGRIEERLAEQEKWSIEDLKAVQVDTRAYAAADIVATMTEVLSANGVDLSTSESAALTTLKEWDFRHGPDSAGAAIYQVFSTAILREALLDEMGETLFSTYGSLADHWNFFKWFMDAPDSSYWDDSATEKEESREMIIARAFQSSVAFLTSGQGNDVSDWQWGELHTLEFKHPFGYFPLLGSLFNVGPFPVSGGAQQVNNMLYGGGALNFDVVAGPSTRRLIDFSTPNAAYGVLPTGNSGNFMSPHYGDQAAMFIEGDYRVLHSTSAAVEANTESTLVLKAVGG
jgi:penicillin G amidase